MVSQKPAVFLVLQCGEMQSLGIEHPALLQLKLTQTQNPSYLLLKLKYSPGDGNFCPVKKLLFSFPKGGSASLGVYFPGGREAPGCLLPFQFSPLQCSPHPGRKISELSPLSRHHAGRAICWPFPTKLSLMLPGFP